VIVPVLCGAAWDLTGLPWTAFLPMALCAVAMTIFGTALTRRGKSGASASNPMI
jgi:hypothetical protein